MTGGIVLLSRDDKVAASWKFTSLMEHWTRKHAQAAYIPSMFREPPPEYAYGPRILLCEQTDFSLFLKAVSDCAVYYDPAIKMEKASSESPAIDVYKRQCRECARPPAQKAVTLKIQQVHHVHIFPYKVSAI